MVVLKAATRTGLLVLGLLWATPAFASDGWPTHIAIGTYMTLNGMDLATTEYLLGAGKAREANPILAPFSSNPVAFGAVKMGTASLTSYLLLRMHKAHPKWAFVLANIGNVVYAGVVYHNSRLAR